MYLEILISGRCRCEIIQVKFIRVLLTDSGHYFFPIDRNPTPAESQQEQEQLRQVFCQYFDTTLKASGLSGSQTKNSTATSQSFTAETLVKVPVDTQTVSVPPSPPVHTLETVGGVSTPGDTRSLEEKKPDNSVEQDPHKKPNKTQTIHAATETKLECPPGLSEWHDRSFYQKGLTSKADERTVEFFATWHKVKGLKWSGKNVYPKSFSEQRKAQLDKYYATKPEEFYQTTKLPVITPDNFEDFLKLTAQFGKVQFQERFACSARLSLYMLNSDNVVTFPVDYRYGWDLQDPAHRALLDKYREVIGIDITYNAPSCQHWSCAGRRAPEAKRQENRKVELPMLHWLVEDTGKATQNNDDMLFENPLTSDIWTKSPLQQLPAYGLKPKKGDQCRHGLKVEGLPIRKSTR